MHRCQGSRRCLKTLYLVYQILKLSDFPRRIESIKHRPEQLEWTRQGKHTSNLETAIVSLERYTKALTPIRHLQLSQIVMTVIQIEEHSSDLDMVMCMTEAAPLLAVRHHPV